MEYNTSCMLVGFLGIRVHIDSILFMTRESFRVSKDERGKSMKDANSWGAISGLSCCVIERGVDATEAIQVSRPQIVDVTSALCHEDSMEGQSAVQRVLTLLFMGRQSKLTQMSVEQGLTSKWRMILRVTNVCTFTNADEIRGPEVEGDRTLVVRENADGPAFLEQQDVELSMEISCDNVEGIMLLTTKNVLACDSEVKTSEIRSTTCKLSWIHGSRQRSDWSLGGIRNVKTLDLS